MFTRSDELEDMVKGYLKSSKVLENKLIRLSSLKHAVNIVEQLPIKYDVDEQPAEDDYEDQNRYSLN